MSNKHIVPPIPYGMHDYKRSNPSKHSQALQSNALTEFILLAQLQLVIARLPPNAMRLIATDQNPSWGILDVINSTGVEPLVDPRQYAEIADELFWEKVKITAWYAYRDYINVHCPKQSLPPFNCL